MSKYALALAAAFGLLAGSEARAGIDLDFSSLVGGGIFFDGNTGNFNFLHGTQSGQTSSAFQITGTTGAHQAGAGLFGDIAGVYHIGSITTQGNVQTANVTLASGPATFSINDGSGHTFTATVNWMTISTMGTTGGINGLGQVNLSNISYDGTNEDLAQLATESAIYGGITTISFQFSSQLHLTDLTTPGTTHRTSYSGSVASAPAPSNLALAGIGVAVFGGFGLMRRRKEHLLCA